MDPEMGRCLHIEPSGRPCVRDARRDSSFCHLHDAPPVDEYSGGTPPLRKTVFRATALLLLVVFALETYRILQALLSG